MIKQFSEEGPWIQKVPADLPKLLAELTAKELNSVAETWAEIIKETYQIPRHVKVNEGILDYSNLLQ